MREQVRERPPVAPLGDRLDQGGVIAWADGDCAWVMPPANMRWRNGSISPLCPNGGGERDIRSEGADALTKPTTGNGSEWIMSPLGDPVLHALRITPMTATKSAKGGATAGQELDIIGNGVAVCSPTWLLSKRDRVTM
jgi:hypothetical protein